MKFSCSLMYIPLHFNDMSLKGILYNLHVYKTLAMVYVIPPLAL